MSKAQLSVWTDSKWFGTSCTVVCIIIGFIIVMFIALPTPCFFRNRNKANFTAGVQQLKNISNGLQQEISEKGSLKGVKSEDDVCHHILPGFDNPKDCKGRVKTLVNEICLKDTLNVKIIDEKRYEIRAQSNEKSQCRICVTETTVQPKYYEPGGACEKYDCAHNGE